MLMTRRIDRARWPAAGLALVLAATLSGCLQDPNEAEGGLGGQAFAGGGSADGDGEVTINGVFGGPEQTALEASLKAFEDESGIDVQYTADKDIATTIKQKANAGQTPDIVFFPQPGGLLELADQGHIQPIDTYLDYDELDKTLVPGFLEAARLNGRVYGAPIKMAVKSLVFYPKKAYEAAGYPTQPKSLEEMQRIADRMKADGTAPWCMGWSDAQATGWVGTDWVEEMVLRTAGPDVYDEWTSHEIPFNDQRIVTAFNEFRDMTLAGGQTFGGDRAVLNTPFGNSFNPAFENPPKCWWHRQGDFIASFLPNRVKNNIDTELGVFAFPPSESGFAGQPILGGGDTAALFNGNDEDAIEVMKFLTSDDFGAEWAQAGGWMSPHRTFDPKNYSSALTRQVAAIVIDADVFRFDGSDLMPKEVGSDSFWKGMIAFAEGDSAEQVTRTIEESWPAG